MQKIFCSYSGPDGARLALPLSAALRAEGFEVGDYKQENADLGGRTDGQDENANTTVIERRSVGGVVNAAAFVWTPSPKYVESQYCLLELAAAIAHDRRRFTVGFPAPAESDAPCDAAACPMRRGAPSEAPVFSGAGIGKAIPSDRSVFQLWLAARDRDGKRPNGALPGGDCAAEQQHFLRTVCRGAPSDRAVEMLTSWCARHAIAENGEGYELRWQCWIRGAEPRWKPLCLDLARSAKAEETQLQRLRGRLRWRTRVEAWTLSAGAVALVITPIIIAILNGVSENAVVKEEFHVMVMASALWSTVAVAVRWCAPRWGTQPFVRAWALVLLMVVWVLLVAFCASRLGKPPEELAHHVAEAPALGGRRPRSSSALTLW